MYLAISLVLAFVFAIALNQSIRKHSLVWYGVSIVIVILEWFFYDLGIRETFPDWFTTYFVNIFKRGVFPVALFVLIMFVGVLNPNWTVTKKLRKIRGRLSIIACYLTYGHLLIYGKTHFVKLFTNPGAMQLHHLIAAILSLLMLGIMTPLLITSFKWVRKQMNGATWKKIHRSAYLFFALIYLHVMVLFIPNANRKALDIIVYTIVFGSYFLLKLRKVYRKKSTACSLT